MDSRRSMPTDWHCHSMKPIKLLPDFARGKLQLKARVEYERDAAMAIKCTSTESWRILISLPFARKSFVLCWIASMAADHAQGKCCLMHLGVMLSTSMANTLDRLRIPLNQLKRIWDSCRMLFEPQVRLQWDVPKIRMLIGLRL